MRLCIIWAVICLHAKYAQRASTIRCTYKCTKCSEFDSNLNSATPYVQYSIHNRSERLRVCPTKLGRINEFKCAHCKLISLLCYRWNPHIAFNLAHILLSPSCISYSFLFACFLVFIPVSLFLFLCSPLLPYAMVMSGAVIQAQCLRKRMSPYM